MAWITARKGLRERDGKNQLNRFCCACCAYGACSFFGWY
ncbi:TPA: hypothetical protein DCZ32_00440 [Candidatus Uhrbacteria bacterium]|nr:hypothetical protein [Candidatus Uhrbacteria bacterium]